MIYIFIDMSESCATSSTVQCVLPLDIPINNVDQVVEPAKKRGRGRPKKPGTFVTCFYASHI